MGYREDGGEWEVWFITKRGLVRYHASRRTKEWAQNLARDLTDAAYPRRIYFVRPRVAMVRGERRRLR